MRVLVLFVYGVLILGSVTTVYPFMLMFATSFTSHTDFEEYRLIPRYLYDDTALLVKYLEEKYRREHFELFKLRYKLEEPYEDVVSGQKVERKYGRFLETKRAMRPFDLQANEFKARVGDWIDFTARLPMKYKDTFFHMYIIPAGFTDVAFQQFLKERYPTIEELKKAIPEDPDFFVLVRPPFETYERHSWYPSADAKTRLWEECREQLPTVYMNVMTCEPIYQKALMDIYGNIDELNAAWGASYDYFWQIDLPIERPEGAEGEDWEYFIRKKIPLRYVRLDVEKARDAFTAYIEEKYGTLKRYRVASGDEASSFAEARLHETMPQQSRPLSVWQDFYENGAPIEAIVQDTADVRYARYLEEKYGEVEALNTAYGTAFASFDEVDPPWRRGDYWDLMTRKGEIIRHFLTRNYIYVLKRVFLQGRPLLNTFILVTLTVLAQVTVNPLAAYALSRYRLSYASKVLIFMLATMAFPAEVTMIPNFLMIKRLGLMNTFGALVLPGLANGYYVFLLKGFFDSLPQELYEAASIDGASEFKMFYTITLPLSLPVLSVIALYAFSFSYGSFLWALTTCQDKKMWTLMVFLQQFQIEAPSVPYVIMAALILAAIPTIIVFLSAQKVLMRGIVVPTMK